MDIQCKNFYLLETYHINNVFDNLLDDVYDLILRLCNTFKQNIEYYATLYNNKYKFIGYDYVSDNDTVIKEKDVNKCKLPIYLKIVIDDGYKFAISRKSNKRLVIECNIMGIFSLYIQHSSISEFKSLVKSGLRHEFLHIYQQQKDKLFDFKTFDKLDIIKQYLDNADDLPVKLTDKHKQNIIALFQLALKAELDACLNGVSEKLSSYTKRDIFKEVNKKYHKKEYKITDLVIKTCSEIVSEESKLSYIQPILEYVKTEGLIPVMEKINKYIHIYNGYILFYFKDYEVKILKLIYYVLDNIIKYDTVKNELTEFFNVFPEMLDTHFKTIFD